MKECIIGIDAGTASVKGLLVDASGTIIATASAPVRLSTPRPGWAEQSPEDWWKATIQLLDTLTVDRNLEILAVSISGQMHSLVPLDVAGDVVRPAILWCDQRTQQECVELTEACGGEQEVIKTFGNPVLTGFTAPKLLWLRTNEPDNFARIARFCLPKDYLVLKLTGRLAIEPSCVWHVALPRARGRVGRSHPGRPDSPAFDAAGSGGRRFGHRSDHLPGSATAQRCSGRCRRSGQCGVGIRVWCREAWRYSRQSGDQRYSCGRYRHSEPGSHGSGAPVQSCHQGLLLSHGGHPFGCGSARLVPAALRSEPFLWSYRGDGRAEPGGQQRCPLPSVPQWRAYAAPRP